LHFKSGVCSFQSNQSGIETEVAKALELIGGNFQSNQSGIETKTKLPDLQEWFYLPIEPKWN